MNAILKNQTSKQDSSLILLKTISNVSRSGRAESFSSMEPSERLLWEEDLASIDNIDSYLLLKVVFENTSFHVSSTATRSPSSYTVGLYLGIGTSTGAYSSVYEACKSLVTVTGTSSVSETKYLNRSLWIKRYTDGNWRYDDSSYLYDDSDSSYDTAEPLRLRITPNQTGATHQWSLNLNAKIYGCILD